MLHINLSPFGGVGSDPDIFVAGFDPEGGASAKDSGLAVDVPLQPIRMFFGQSMRSFIGVSGNAFGPGNINERAIARPMRFFSNSTNGIELFLRIDEAFVAAFDVVVHFDAENIVARSFGDDRVSVRSI